MPHYSFDAFEEDLGPVSFEYILDGDDLAARTEGLPRGPTYDQVLDPETAVLVGKFLSVVSAYARRRGLSLEQCALAYLDSTVKPYPNKE